jgi:hypothetical protein
VFGGNGLGLAPFPDGFRADATAFSRGFSPAQKGDDLFNTAHGWLIWEKTSQGKEKEMGGKIPPWI